MLDPKKLLKAAARASLIGLAAAAVFSTPAGARTFVRCDRDGDRCVRIHCDWDGDRCWRHSIWRDRDFYRGRGHWHCHHNGDDCRWVYRD